MALPHADLLDVISLAPLGEALKESVSTSLIKTQRVQLLHLVLRAHEDLPQHHVADECVVHCLEGCVEVVYPGGVRQLVANQAVVLPAQQAHALRARTDAAVLLTLLLQGGDASGKGGGGHALEREDSSIGM